MNGRINLCDLKSQLVKNIGPDRAKCYFHYFSKLLSQKLSKVEFNKLCISTLGSENLHLHNQLVRAVLKNAYQAKTPPQSSKPTYPNGNTFRHSLRRSASDIYEKDEVVLSNGHLKRPFHLLEEEHLVEESVKKHPKTENAEQDNVPRNLPIQAPLGIPNRAQRPLTCKFNTSVDFGELSDSQNVLNRMDQIAKMQGLDGVRLDTANLLNMGLDVHLKKLIGVCSELVKVKSSKEQYMEKNVNGIWQESNVHTQSGGPASDDRRSISLNDFRVAMELNPQRLGENWSLLLEKICMSSFEE